MDFIFDLILVGKSPVATKMQGLPLLRSSYISCSDRRVLPDPVLPSTVIVPPLSSPPVRLLKCSNGVRYLFDLLLVPRYKAPPTTAAPPIAANGMKLKGGVPPLNRPKEEEPPNVEARRPWESIRSMLS